MVDQDQGGEPGEDQDVEEEKRMEEMRWRIDTERRQLQKRLDELKRMEEEQTTRMEEIRDAREEERCRSQEIEKLRPIRKEQRKRMNVIMDGRYRSQEIEKLGPLTEEREKRTEEITDEYDAHEESRYQTEELEEPRPLVEEQRRQEKKPSGLTRQEELRSKNEAAGRRAAGNKRLEDRQKMAEDRKREAQERIEKQKADKVGVRSYTLRLQSYNVIVI